MDENFVEVLKHELNREDLKTLTNQTREHESIARLKRRWLMDLPLSEKEQKRIEELLPPNDKIMPESFLREDDVGYEDIRICIEKAFGACNSREEPTCVQANLRIFNSSAGLKEVSFLLDAMTNKGLCSFARILMGGLDKFDKTRFGMVRTINELLPKVIADKSDISRSKLKRCSQLLKVPTNFQGYQMVPFTNSGARQIPGGSDCLLKTWDLYVTDAFKLLEKLEDFPSSTLHAMHRKLNGVKGYIPPLRPRKTGWGRDKLISSVRNKCKKMLSDIGEGEEPAEQLVGALGVAGLTLKLIRNRSGVRDYSRFAPEMDALHDDFRRFSPEMDALHADIAKAIYLLEKRKRVSLIELRKVQRLLDPNMELSEDSMPTAVRNLLTEYLYECSDMDKVPDFLIETLDIINREAQLGSHNKSSSKGFLTQRELIKEQTEEEMQHVLNISAQAKEVVANVLPQHEFDEEFAHAYMEVYDGNDTLCVFDDDLQMEDGCHYFIFKSGSSYDQKECIGEINPEAFNSPISTSKRNGTLSCSSNGRSDMALESVHLNKMDSNGSCDFLHSPSYKDIGSAYSGSTKVTIKRSLFSPSHSPSRNSSHNELRVEETTSCSPSTAKNGFSGIKVEEKDFCHQSSSSINGYLELQEACDTTSMVAYRFAGYMLDTLAKTEGLKLCQGDRLYLHSHASVPEDSEEFSDMVSKFNEVWTNVVEH